MALVRFGDAGPVAGLQTETFGYLQNIDVSEEYDEAEAKNEIGETITYAMFNKRWTGSFEFIDKTGSTIPVTATSIALANVTEIAKVIVTKKIRTPQQVGFQGTKYEFKSWSQISL